MSEQFCIHCRRKQPTYTDESTCLTYCEFCGKVIASDCYQNEPTFDKGAGGESKLSGSFVNFARKISESLERSLEKGSYTIRDLSEKLKINNKPLEDEAAIYYKIVAEKGFTRGRRIDQIAGACLYIACRINKKPFLLIDFSEKLGINVYVLGAVFLQLCQSLSLNEHEIVQKPIDPSLFIDLFTDRLLNGKNTVVSKIAVSIIASMKRDWMQTGRKPSGLCGAAIYIAALSQGYSCTKSDVIKVVHICDATLTKRLIEFENTDSGSLTIEEFTEKAEDLQLQLDTQKLSCVESTTFGSSEVVCKHKKEKPFAHGLCEDCYGELIEISGGFQGGSDPPAFQKSERERTAEICNVKEFVAVDMDTPHPEINNGKFSTETSTDTVAFGKANQNVYRNGKAHLVDFENRNTIEDEVRVDIDFDMSDKNKAVNSDDESVCLSDIDDTEVNEYLNNKEETKLKKLIWEEMNKEYLEEQAAKEAAAAATAVNLDDLPDDLRAAYENSAAAAAAVAKSRKERQQQRALDAKNAIPPSTAAEATRQILTKKRLSNKVNFDALNELLSDDPLPVSKKTKYESKEETMDNKNDEFGLGSDGEDEPESYVGHENEDYDFYKNDDSDGY